MSLKYKRKNRKIKKPIVTILVVLVLLLLQRYYPSIFESNNTITDNVVEFNQNDTSSTPLSSDFKIHFIDIGQGDCTLIEDNGEYTLIDAGIRSSGDKIIQYLNECNVDKIKYFVLTHSHADHIGGAADVINNFEVEKIIFPQIPKDLIPTTATFEETLEAINKFSIPVEIASEDKMYDLGSGALEVIYPRTDDIDNANNTSVITMYTSSTNFKFLSTGDAEYQIEEQLLLQNAPLKADLFKLGHHGSSTSNTYKFIKEINPSLVVACCGIDNKYGHPHIEVVEMLENLNIKLLQTATNGDIVITVDEKGIEFTTEK